MSFFRHACAFCLVLGATLSVFANDAPDPTNLEQTTQSVIFARLVDDFFDQFYRFNPSQASSVGEHHWDKILEDLSHDAITRRIAMLKTQLTRLSEIERDRLTRDELIDATLLENAMRDELLDEEEIQAWHHDPLQYIGIPGAAIDALIKRDFAPAKERLADVTTRLNQVPRLLQQMRANLENPPREFTELAHDTARGTIEFFEGPLQAWADQAVGHDVAAQHAFLAARKNAVLALHDCDTWLLHDLLPRSRGHYALGSPLFERKLHYEEMVDIPLDQLEVIAQNTLQADHNAFVELAHQIDPAHNASTVMHHLAEDHPTGEQLLPFVRTSLRSARQFIIDRAIVSIPSTLDPTVAFTPSYDRADTLALTDTPGPLEQRAMESFYYITAPQRSWDARRIEEHLQGLSRPVLTITTLHEAFPGHYMQYLVRDQVPTKVRRLLSADTNTEGWAHYVEQMMVEEGYGEHEPRLQLAQLEEALLRDCRFVVSIALHTQQMSVREASRCFRDQAFQSPANAMAEARRGTYNPTYLSYTLGKLEIYKLRADYAHKQGEDFSLQQFHDAFLRQGELPIALVRQILLPGDRSPPL